MKTFFVLVHAYKHNNIEIKIKTKYTKHMVSVFDITEHAIAIDSSVVFFSPFSKWFYINSKYINFVSITKRHTDLLSIYILQQSVTEIDFSMTISKNSFFLCRPIHISHLVLLSILFVKEKTNCGFRSILFDHLIYTQFQ